MAMGTAFGQESVPDPNAEGFDVVKYVNDYIKEHWVVPDPQGEFETTGEWKWRVYKQKKELMDEALKKLYGDNPFHEKIGLKLGRYKIGEGYFPMTTNGFGTYAFVVTYLRGPFWREKWDTKQFGVRYTYGLVNGKPRLINLKVVDAGIYEKVYFIDEETGEVYEFKWDGDDGVWRMKETRL